MSKPPAQRSKRNRARTAAREPSRSTAGARTQPAAIVVAILFFLSGMSGLVYEVIWSRHLQELFGVSSFAITTVVAAYMAGLALGSGLVGRLADRFSPAGAVLAYGLLEVVIGLFAFGFIPLLQGLAQLYRGLGSLVFANLTLRVLLDFLLSFALLMIPTTLMGGTLPLIARFFAAATRRTGQGFGWAYALNTAGAVLGTFLAGFVLLHTLGLSRSLLLFGCLNLAVGATAILLNRQRFTELRSLSGAAAGAPVPAAELEAAPAGRHFLLLAALSGCVALGAEIVWVRGFASLLLSTTHTFSLVLMVYLIGIAAGSALGARLRLSHARLTWLFIALATATLTQLALYPAAHALVVRWVQARPEYALLLLQQAAIVAAVVLPLTLCSGAALPLIVAGYSHGLGRAGRDVGAVYIANTAGAVLGTILAGFALLPQVGAMTGSRILALLALGGAALALSRQPERGLRPRAPAAASRPMPSGNRLPLQPHREQDAHITLHSGLDRIAWAGIAAVAGCALLWPAPSLERQAYSPVLLGKRIPPDAGPEAVDQVARLQGGSLGLVTFAHGLAADAAISVDFANSQTALWINGMPNASSRVDQKTQIHLALLPYLYAADTKECLHIGLGSGITAGAWAALPGSASTRVVELESSLWRLSRRFDPYHFGLHSNPNVEFIADDANAYLELLPPASLDVIASQPSQLWSKGIGNLFTREFFRTARARLRPDGLFATWVMGYDVSGEVWALALATLLDEFPHVFAFRILDGGDVLFLCSQQPLQFHPERWQRLAAERGPARAMLRSLGLERPEDLALYAFADDRTLRREVQATLAAAGWSGLRNSVDRPLLEYLYPRWFVSDARNALLERLQEQRLRPGPGGAAAFLMPPGLEGRSLRPEIALELSFLTGADPIHVLTGGASAAGPIAPAALSTEQLQWSFIASVRRGDLRTARGLWQAAVRAHPIVEPALIEAVYDYAQATRQPALIAELNRQLPPAGPELPLALVLRRLDSHWIPERAPAAYVESFIAAMPARRYLLDSMPPAHLQILVEAAELSSQLPRVEAYLAGADRAYHGHLPWVACALAEIRVRQGDLEAARRAFPSYADPHSAHPYLRNLQIQLGLRSE